MKWLRVNSNDEILDFIVNKSSSLQPCEAGKKNSDKLNETETLQSNWNDKIITKHFMNKYPNEFGGIVPSSAYSGTWVIQNIR